MIRRCILPAGLALGLTVSAFAQKPKSIAEQTALQAMFADTDPDKQIADANAVIEKFADTEFKSIALFFIARDYQVKGDFAKSVTFGERALEADPKNYQAMLVVASEYAQNTKDTDFDKDDKLKKADKLANDALTTIKTAPKPNPALSDAQWVDARKDMSASAYEIVGQVALTRKKPADAVAAFQSSVDIAINKEPATYVRLAQADNMIGKYDDAIANAEKAMSAPSSNAAVKQFAQAERARAMQKKGSGAAAAVPAAPASAPPASAPPAPAPQTSDTPATPPQP